MSRLKRLILNACLIAAALLLGLFIATQDPGGRPALFEPWGVFHNYLGAKYFNEIGPFDIYACATAADATHALWPVGVLVRDLHTYSFVPASSLRCPQDDFSIRRWSSFQNDISWITGTATPDYWSLAVTDKGYDGTPFWSVVFGGLANMVNIHHPAVRFIMFNADYLCVAIAIAIVWYASGMTMALFTLVLSLGFFGNFGRIGGNFFQYAWFPLLALAVAAWRMKKPTTSGIALGIAAAMQAFPIVFAAPIAILGLRSFRARTEKWERTVQFFTALACTLVICFAVGCLSSRGVGGWDKWRQKISAHSSYLHGEIFNIGLPNLLSDIMTRASAPAVDYYTYAQDIPVSQARVTVFDSHRPYWYISIACLLALTILAAWRISEEHVFVLGFVPIYALFSMSPYFYFGIIFIPFMAFGIQRKRYRLLVGAWAALLVYHLLMWGGTYISYSFVDHFVSEILFLSFILLIPTLVLYKKVEDTDSIDGARFLIT